MLLLSTISYTSVCCCFHFSERYLSGTTCINRNAIAIAKFSSAGGRGGLTYTPSFSLAACPFSLLSYGVPTLLCRVCVPLNFPALTCSRAVPTLFSVVLPLVIGVVPTPHWAEKGESLSFPRFLAPRQEESTARAYGVRYGVVYEYWDWTSLPHRPRDTLPQPSSHAFPRFPTTLPPKSEVTEQIIAPQLTPHVVKTATPPTHLQSIPPSRITRKSPQSVIEPDIVSFWFETYAGALPCVTISSTNVLTVFVIICRRHLWLSSCGVVQQQQVSIRMLSSTLHAMPLGTPGPSQIRQEIPECYQEPLSIVYLHHVSSDSRVSQPHCSRLWLNTLLLTTW